MEISRTIRGDNKMKLKNIDCIEGMKELDANSVDSIVTDPPYGLKFMSKEFDNLGDGAQQREWHKAWAKEALRVLKPGGHLLAFGGTRTYHHLASALEEVGFEIRDQMQWLYGSGFPKSHNISKAIDKEAGVKRKVIGSRLTNDIRKNNYENSQGQMEYQITEAHTEEAKEWDGWGTALKPANEPIVLARKPLSEKTIAQNIIKWGTGGLNIDESRIATADNLARPLAFVKDDASTPFCNPQGQLALGHKDGRWPSNVIIDENVTEQLDNDNPKNKPAKYFYCPKASTAEREEGLTGEGQRKNNHPTVKPIALMEYLCKLITPPNGIVLEPFLGSGTTGLAALNLDYDFIGFEKDPDYFKIAETRIENR